MSRYERQILKNLIIGTAIMFGAYAVLTIIFFGTTIVGYVLESNLIMVVSSILGCVFAVLAASNYCDLKIDIEKLEEQTDSVKLN